jgi:hypothetical protein
MRAGVATARPAHRAVEYAGIAMKIQANNATDTSAMRTVSPEALGKLSFRFRSGNASIKGGIGGAVLVGAFLAWATFTGRIHEPNLAYFGGWILGGVVTAALLWRGQRRSVRYAESLGHIELDDEALRWIRSDQTVVAEFEWSRVEQATVEFRTSTVVVVVRSEEPDAPLAATLLGDPTGAILFEDFDGFRQAVARHCALKDSAATPLEPNRGMAKTLWVWAAVFGTSGAALFWINGMIEGAAPAQHMFPLGPLAFGFLALVYALAAFAFWRGRGPMVSQLYSPPFLKRRVPMMCVLLVLVNFAQVGMGFF